jgi:hypothetical protein
LTDVYGYVDSLFSTLAIISSTILSASSTVIFPSEIAFSIVFFTRSSQDHPYLAASVEVAIFLFISLIFLLFFS